ncbi:hypothetical protein DWG18_13130 [Lysobacter sp. TY2-98]|uniref:hypothetical protein n=1 Tax=Lysobacter sp. TY2-98 TaxID=2290922 RepID=UPI000E1FCE69|nr:hypothetical protein [Lysobacter sp. TY2-98]AXK73129.1 hypothetical protein DWG18_13130 [Lysobacter sp. TY2-98]
MRLHLHAVLVIAGATALVAPAAFAGNVVDPLVAPVAAAAATQLVPAATSNAVNSLDATAMTTDALDDLRGGTDIKDSFNVTTTTNTADNDGNVSGNTAQNTVSGVNLVDGGSFGNAAGLNTVIQNSGNNVLIQNSTVVSIQFTPSP